MATEVDPNKKKKVVDGLVKEREGALDALGKTGGMTPAEFEQNISNKEELAKREGQVRVRGHWEDAKPVDNVDRAVAERDARVAAAGSDPEAIRVANMDPSAVARIEQGKQQYANALGYAGKSMDSSILASESDKYAGSFDRGAAVAKKASDALALDATTKYNAESPTARLVHELTSARSTGDNLTMLNPEETERRQVSAMASFTTGKDQDAQAVKGTDEYGRPYTTVTQVVNTDKEGKGTVSSRVYDKLNSAISYNDFGGKGTTDGEDIVAATARMNKDQELAAMGNIQKQYENAALQSLRNTPTKKKDETEKAFSQRLDEWNKRNSLDGKTEAEGAEALTDKGIFASKEAQDEAKKRSKKANELVALLAKGGGQPPRRRT